MTTRIHTHKLICFTLGVAPLVGCDLESMDTEGLEGAEFTAGELTSEDTASEDMASEDMAHDEASETSPRIPPGLRLEVEAPEDETLLLDTSGVDFGGAYGHVNDVDVANPATGGMSCPAGYTSTMVLGTSGVDHKAYFCSRQRQEGLEPVFDFGGMWGYVGGAVVKNPFTNAASCPTGYTDQKILDTTNVDYPVHVCYKPHQSGTAPEVRFGGMWGHVNGAAVANPATGAASCPTGYTDTLVLHNINVDWPLHFCWMPGDREEDFGGAYGHANGVAVPNPATGGMSCPAGYTSTMVLGTPNVDHQVHFCSRPHKVGEDPIYDFGGMLGHVNGYATNNPITNRGACPTGYTAQTLLDTPYVDYPMDVCYKAHGTGEAPAARFGGMWGHVNGAPTVNPATGAASCPIGYTDTAVLGTVNVDWGLHVCTVPSRRPTDRSACAAEPAAKPCVADVQKAGIVPYANCTYGFHTGLNWGSGTAAFYDQIDRCAYLHDNQCWNVNHLTGVNEGSGGCSQTVNFMACVDKVMPASAEEVAAKECIQNSLIAVGANICEPLHEIFGRGFLYPLYAPTTDPSSRCSSGWYFDGVILQG